MSFTKLITVKGTIADIRIAHPSATHLSPRISNHSLLPDNKNILEQCIRLAPSKILSSGVVAGDSTPC